MWSSTTWSCACAARPLPACCACGAGRGGHACARAQVVLPEGATDLKHDLPFSVDASADRKLTYLDSAGRPVLALHKRNLVPDHNVPLTVTIVVGMVPVLFAGRPYPTGLPAALCTLLRAPTTH